MLVLLHSVPIALSSRNTRVTEQWRTLFDYSNLWPRRLLIPRSGLKLKSCQIHPNCRQVRRFTRRTPPLAVYAVNDNELILRLVNQVHMTLQLGVSSLDKPRQQPDAQIFLTSRTLEDGSFEDVTTLARAPMLRRRGFYMVHAFCAAHDNQSVTSYREYFRTDLLSSAGNGTFSKGTSLPSAAR